MAGDCAYETHYVNDDTFGSKQLFGRNQELVVDSGVRDTAKGSKSIKAVVSSPYFEIVDGVLYRKKLEKGYVSYREVLDGNRQLGAIAAFHQEPPGKRHRTLDDTYRTVADNYWWEGMYFHIREYVLGCPQCQAQQRRKEDPVESRVSRTLASHGNAVLHKLSSQREAGLFCDITLKTGSRSFPAHRAVLAAVSEYFQEIFAEMDSDGQPTVDLTGFREESVLPLLEFSYTSTLSLSVGDLAEVSALAQHFRMWPAVEACRAMQSERDGDAPKPGAGAFHERPCPVVTSRAQVLHQKRKRGWSLGERDSVQSGEAYTLTFDPASVAPSWRGRESHTPSSPVRRLKLMDFKSPSSKVKTPPQNPPPGTPVLQMHTMAQQSPLSPCSKRYRQRLSWAELGAGPAGAEQGEEEGQGSRAQEKYRLLSMLGLQRRGLLPRPEEPTGWRQKRRLRKLKVSSYALTRPRKPRAPPHGDATGLPLCNRPAPPSPALLQPLIKTEPPEPVSVEDMRLGRGRGRRTPGWIPERTQLRRSVRRAVAPPRNPAPEVPLPAGRKSARVKREPDAPPICPQPPSTPSAHARPRGRPRKHPPRRASALAVQTAAQQSGVRPRGRPKSAADPSRAHPLARSLLRTVKEEPADALPVTSAQPTPVPAGRRRRQSKPPLRLLDPGFLFPLSRPVAAVKKEEVGGDVWLARSGPYGTGSGSGIARTRHSLRRACAGLGSDRKQLHAQGPSAPLLNKRRVRRRLLDRGATGALPRPALRANKAKQTAELPKNLHSVSSLQHQRSAALESVRKARIKRLRERRIHTPVTSHTCLQCKTAYWNCDTLIMHRIRHIEGKHWPCPLCSKTFFRQRNVQSHIRTHDPKLYKCSSCILAP
ncbi:hypothetical protein SKAU_G00253040 [Synaphobranchus kaupii]|uniref:Uncharacterized protein n=1 Tax=Synaphobranchus kaupii TaxID=118154 RepID=A0A9Q1F383_SYNKA|nr:hypothetical protein SKAU_G00253040 [Synaphobranchus kaupii]